MKFSALVLLPLLFSSSTVFAAMGRRDVFRARQAHVKRDFADVCAALDVDADLTPCGHNMIAGHLNLCLCLSALPGFLGSNPVAKTVVNQLGQDDAHDYFTKLIQGQQNKQQCTYPPQATPFCSVQRPCDFKCNNGYTPFPSTNPTQCVCQAPSTECNGVCGSFPRGCSSQGVSKPKRDQNTCPTGKTICGLPSGGDGVDCVDTGSDPESCGGCTVGSPLGDNVANGKNCKALPNVDQVSCDNGACTVISCKGDFDVSPQKDGCVQRGIKRVRKTRGAEVVDDVFDRLVSHKLLADWFNIAAGKAKIFATISVLNYNNVLLFLLNQNAIVGAPDLSTLRNMLDLGASQLRRDSPYTVDGVLNVLFQRNLIIRCSDIPCIKGFLGTNIEVLIISDLLQLLVSQGFIVQGTDILDLKQMFGLA